MVSNSGGLIGARAPFLPRNNFILPKIYNVDFRIAREFRIRERLRLSLVGEAFNLFNHPIITVVGPTGSIGANTFNYVGSGTGVCAGHTNGCIVPNPAFPTPTTTSSAIYGPGSCRFPDGSRSSARRLIMPPPYHIVAQIVGAVFKFGEFLQEHQFDFGRSGRCAASPE